MSVRHPAIIGTMRVVIPILVLAIVWQLADGRQVLDRLRRLDWLWLLAALLALALQIVLSAVRWQLVARSLGIALGRERAISEYFLAQLINQTVPGGVVGDAARAMRSRHGAGISRSAQAVIIERLAGQIALFFVLAVGLSVSLSGLGSLDWPDTAQANLLTGLVIICLIVLLMAAAVMTVQRLRGFVQTARRALLAPSTRASHFALALAIVACNLSAFAFCARATGTALGLEATIVLVPLILCAMLIPASIAGWGFREGAAAALFPLAGASAAAGMAASVTFGATMLIASLPGAIFIFARPQPIGTSES